MKINWKTLLRSIAEPLLVGALAGWIAKDIMAAFSALNKPPLSPPGWLFPVVWTILYVLMGLAAYLIRTSDAPQPEIQQAMKRYRWQLLLNALWTFWFFNLQLYYFAFAWLIALWILILATIISFSRISKPAAVLLIPYLLWVTFAGYLNLAIARLN